MMSVCEKFPRFSDERIEYESLKTTISSCKTMRVFWFKCLISCRGKWQEVNINQVSVNEIIKDFDDKIQKASLELKDFLEKLNDKEKMGNTI